MLGLAARVDLVVKAWQVRASAGLGLVHRGVCAADQRADIGAVVGMHRVATEPRDGVALAQHRARPRPYRPQQCIPGGMAERVVDPFEAVEVAEHDADAASVAPGHRDCAGDPVFQQCAPRQAGHLVEVGEFLVALLELPACGDVGRDAEQQRLAGRTNHRHLDRLVPARLASRVAELVIERKRAPRGQHLLVDALVARVVVREGEDVGQQSALHLVDIERESLRDCPVGNQEATLPVAHLDHRRHGIDQQSHEQAFARQCLLGRSLCGDVARDDGGSDHLVASADDRGQRFTDAS